MDSEDRSASATPLPHAVYQTAEELETQERQRRADSMRQADAELAALVATVENAVETAPDDIEAALSSKVIAALAELQSMSPPTFMRLRGALKRANSDIQMPNLQRMIDEAAGDDQTFESSDEGSHGSVESIIETVIENGELFVGEDEEAYVRFERDGHKEVWALESRAFRESVSHQAYSATGRAPRAAQIADAMNVLGGVARHEGEVHSIYLRVAPHPNSTGGYLIDVGDDGWRVIEVTTTGWRVLDESPVRFRRTKGMKPLPMPAAEGSIEDLRMLVNVSVEAEPLLLAALLDCWRPDTAFPVVELGGEEGSGKSVTASNIRALVDPTAVPLRAAPKSVDDLFVGARQNHLVNLNNLSRLSAEMQDGLCTLSTGGGLAGRRLYTNDEEVVHEAKRPVIMNGISTLATQSDLLSRVVRIECPKLTDPSDDRRGNERVSDDDMAARFEHHGPRTMRFLLDLFVEALCRLPDVELSKAPRLMDFARLGEAANQARGMDPGAFTEVYVSALREAAVQSLESVPVIEVLVEHARQHAQFSPLTLTVGELFARLNESAGSRRDAAWPRTSKGFGDAMRRAAPAMRMVGVTIEFGQKGRDGRPVTVRASTIYSLPKNTKAPMRPSQQSPLSQNPDERPVSDSRDGGDRHKPTSTFLREREKCTGTPSSLTRADYAEATGR